MGADLHYLIYEKLPELNERLLTEVIDIKNYKTFTLLLKKIIIDVK
ncbi:MAG: hypothetical protein ACK5G7_03880 [Erysipelotrichaceae bacterium]